MRGRWREGEKARGREGMHAGWSYKSRQERRGREGKVGEGRVPLGASLVAQWLRIRLPMQGTRVRALVREVPTCHGATKPVHHNY